MVVLGEIFIKQFSQILTELTMTGQSVEIWCKWGSTQSKLVFTLQCGRSISRSINGKRGSE